VHEILTYRAENIENSARNSRNSKRGQSKTDVGRSKI